MCQGCVDEGRLSQWMADVIAEFCRHYDDVEFGLGHIVLDDFNVKDSHIEFCLKQPDDEHYPAEVRAFLRWMLTVSDTERKENAEDVS